MYDKRNCICGRNIPGILFFLFLFFNIHITGFLVQLHNNYICAPCFMNKKCNPEWLTVTGQ